MNNRARHKAAVSITLDNDILAFFSGKGRSGKINHILRLYLRSRLNDEDTSFDEKTNRQLFMPGLAVMQRQFGDDSIEAKIMLMLKDVVE